MGKLSQSSDKQQKMQKFSPVKVSPFTVQLYVYT